MFLLVTESGLWINMVSFTKELRAFYRLIIVVVSINSSHCTEIIVFQKQ